MAKQQRMNSLGIVTKPKASIAIIFLLIVICMFALFKSTNREMIDYDHFHNLFLASGTNSTLAAYLSKLTRQPHLAGTTQGERIADYVNKAFKKVGLETEVVKYSVLLSYPKEVRLEVSFGNGSVRVLEVLEPGFGGAVMMPYHAYSPSGSVVGWVVYVNFGREEDYDVLEGMGVNVSGCVVVVRRGGLGRGGAVEIAAGRGAVGVLMYTEEGREEGVERGTVMLGGIGDPLSPGWAAVEGGEKLDVTADEVLKRFPKIPSVPISARVAGKFLGFLGGHKVPEEWMGKLKFFGVGPGPVMLNMTYLVRT